MNVGSGGGGAAAAPAAGGAAAAAGGAAEEAPKEEEKEEGELNYRVMRGKCWIFEATSANVFVCLQRKRSRMKTWASVSSIRRYATSQLRCKLSGTVKFEPGCWLNASPFDFSTVAIILGCSHICITKILTV